MAFAELTAGSHWQAVDFISDLHLQSSEPKTFDAWQRYMQTTPADAVFILGDLFEVWVGDDALQPGSFEEACANVLKKTSARLPTFFMHGNRDFLVGLTAMQACNTTLLADPTVLVFNHQRWLLSHGDALCKDDIDYMAFRRQVRSIEWQQNFLAKPLAERLAIARNLRLQSEALKQVNTGYVDVDSTCACQWLKSVGAQTLVHGHTHRPGDHQLGNSLQRVVLSDWDGAAQPPRAEVVRLTGAGLQRLRLEVS